MRRSPSPASTSELSSAASPDDLDGGLDDPLERGSSGNPRRPPAGLFAAALATLVALPILLSDGNSGALEVETVASSSTTATTSPPSSQADVEIDQVPEEPPARTGVGAAQLSAGVPADRQPETSPSSAAPTTASPTSASPAKVSPTASPTTSAPATAAPTTATPATAAPTTPAAPAPPAAPSDAPSPADSASPTPGPGPEVPETTPEEHTTEATEPATPAAAPTTAEPEPAEPEPAEPEPAEPTAAQWQALRQCESGDDYSIVSSNGLYFGAYQFHQDTWNSIARSAGQTHLVDIQPHHAGPPDQDAMALHLWTQSGWSPWPTCGKKAAAA